MYIIKSTYFILLVSSVFFLEAINSAELSLTIPLLSFSPIFSSLFSFIFLDEKLKYIQYLGIFFILFGTLVLYAKELKLTSIFLSMGNGTSFGNEYI